MSARDQVNLTMMVFLLVSSSLDYLKLSCTEQATLLTESFLLGSVAVTELAASAGERLLL